jgi:hypothetical protein
VAEFFYADCVISDIQIESSTEHQKIVTARIDGRELKKLSMSEEMVGYFNGVGQGTQNRIWFYKYGLHGITLIAAVENAAGERLERPSASAGMKLFDLVMRPVAAGFLFWFAAWVLLFIPVMGVYGVEDAYDIINPIGLYGGIALGLWFSYKVLELYKKLANLDAWAAGDLTRYTKAVFGAGLAALKK